MRKLRLPSVLAALLIFGAGVAEAQSSGTITGRVTSEGQALGGAQVVVTESSSGAQFGALANSEGRYTISNIRAGRYTVSAQIIGFQSVTRNVTLTAGETATVDFELASEAVSISGLEVFASRATERRTPVAFSDVDKVQIQNQLASRDLPLALNVTPSVYSTQQGGGAGDARINVRGFDQRNTAVMINGVPVNDMENGWVYWSNWDGLADAATSIQLQRGLSAINLATPAIGGTLNVITDPASNEANLSVKQEFGSGAFLKTTAVANTGEIGNFALTASGVRKTADGVFANTWTDAWAYYVASSFQVNAKNRLEFYAVGAPQQHGQNLYKLNAATFSHEFASGLDGYDPAALNKFPEATPQGDWDIWSPNVGSVSSSYNVPHYASVGPTAGFSQRQLAGFMGERENYFHKPQLNLNWYSYFGNGLTLSTVGYFSGGQGGGSGTLGSIAWDYSYTQRFPDWDATIARNQANNRGSRGILRSSVNSQWTIGAISKLRKDFANGLTAEIGVDWRTAEIDHYRDVRNLLGGDYWVDEDSDFRGAIQATPGVKIDYWDQTTVDWLGGYAQAEKTSSKGSMFGVFGVSQINYDSENFFVADATGRPLFLTSGNILGYQLKGGAVYNLNDEWSTYTNLGWVSKVPIVDGVIDVGAQTVNQNPTNETFYAFEGGLQYRSLERGLSFNLNSYVTQWNDRTYNLFVRNIDGAGQDGLVNLLGLDARHVGVELEGAWQPSSLLRIDAAVSMGDWTYTDDVSGTYRPDEGSGDVLNYVFYTKDLKVGDQPQTQITYGVSLFPTAGASFQLVGRTYADHYAQFDPFNRTQASEAGIQSWNAPGYTVFDLFTSYNLTGVLPSINSGDVRLFANVTNVFDALFVQDAVDNSRFNGWDGDHDADDAEIFIGAPRIFNLGLQVRF